MDAGAEATGAAAAAAPGTASNSEPVATIGRTRKHVGPSSCTKHNLLSTASCSRLETRVGGVARNGCARAIPRRLFVQLRKITKWQRLSLSAAGQPRKSKSVKCTHKVRKGLWSHPFGVGSKPRQTRPKPARNAYSTDTGRMSARIPECTSRGRQNLLRYEFLH